MTIGMLNGPDDYGPALLAVTWTLTGISAIIIALRLYTRTKIVPVFGWDDVVIIISAVFLFAASGLNTWTVTLDYGKHLADIPPENLPALLRALLVSEVIAVQTFSWPKLSIAFLLTRILNPSRMMVTLLFSLATLVITSTIVLSVLWVVQCSPVQKQWETTMTTGTCWSPAIVENYSIFIGSLSAFVDLFYAIYSIAVVCRLQMPIQKKITLSCILGLGIVCCGIVIYKCTLLIGISSRNDPTYDTAPLVMFTEVEANFLIFTASLPTLGPLLRRFTGGWKRMYTYYRYTNRTGGPSYDSNDSPPDSLKGLKGKGTDATASEKESVDLMRTQDLIGSGVTMFGDDVEKHADIIMKKSELTVEMKPRVDGPWEQGPVPEFLRGSTEANNA